MTPVLGQLIADPVSDILGTGFNRFASASGIDGLAKVEGTRLDILALVSNNPATGQFREFIRQCKESYTTIVIWEVMNLTLEAALKRYGFKAGVDSEILPVWIWEKEP